jgi:hypothetical protein
MAWSLEEQYTRASNAVWSNKLRMAFLKTAFDVTNESDQTPDHTQRLALANQVIDGDMPNQAVFLLPILNPALQVDNPTDNDILFTVSQQWNFFANV